MWQVNKKWGYSDAVNFRPEHPTIRFHSECFNASIVEGSRPPGGNPRPGEAFPPIQLVKNVYNLAPVFVADSTQLIVNRQVKELLTHFAKVEFLPAQIAVAWNYPYEPGNRDYESDDAYDHDTDDTDSVELAFAEKYRIDPPKVELYEVIDYGYRIRDYEFRNDPGKYIDRKVYKLTGTMDGRSGGDCLVSKILLEEVGLYKSWGFICAPELLDMLRPFLRPYFFWVGSFPF